VMVFGHWLVVAASFALIEIAVPAMVCIRLAAVALGTALIVWLVPGLSWEHQALIFGALGVASVAIGRLAFGRIRAKSSDARLNRRAEIYVGRRFTLELPIVDGRGRLKVDDTVWLVEGQDLPAGTHVQVTSVDNTMLRVTDL
jgi:membrane protein implicated in regulation of membrane protease activity